MIHLYGIFEPNLSCLVDAASNPFVDVTLSAMFSQRNRTVHVDGFYDGEGVYRIRLMPNQTGDWTYVMHSSRAFRIEVIDTWEMTITKFPDTWGYHNRIELPCKPYIAVRVWRD
jgi:hypothetical protein